MSERTEVKAVPPAELPSLLDVIHGESLATLQSAPPAIVINITINGYMGNGQSLADQIGKIVKQQLQAYRAL